MKEILRKIQSATIERQINIRDLFSVSDFIGLGEISETQFRNTISKLNSQLSPQELDKLCSKFRVRPAIVNYNHLLQSLNHPKASVAFPANKPALTQIEKSILQKAIEDLKHTTNRQKIHLFPHLQAFDKRRTGFITTNDFKLALSMSGLLRSDLEVLEIMIKNYQEPAGVNYRKLCEEVDSPAQNRPSTSPLDTLENKIRTQIVLRNPNILQTFRFFDPSKRGTVREEDLIKVLDISSISISDHECHLLLERYKDSYGDMRYNEFVEIIKGNKAFSDSVQTKLDIFCILAEVADILKTKNVKLLFVLQRHDTNRVRRISKLNFLVELNQITKNIKQNKIQLLVDYYSDSQGIKYFDLCNDLDNPSHLFKPVPAPVSVELQVPQPTSTVMKRIKNYTKHNNIDLNTAFKRLDLYYTGLVPISQTRDILDSLRLSEADIAYILDNYSVDKYRVDYNRFLKEIKKKPKRVQIDPVVAKKPLYIVSRFSNFITKNRIDFGDLVRRWDPHSLQRINKADLSSAFNQIDFKVSEVEMNSIEENYYDSGVINYGRFLKDASKVENPAGKSDMFNTHFCLNKPPSDSIKAVLMQIKLVLTFNLKKPSDLVRKYDPLGHGVVTSRNFQLILQELGLKLSQNDRNLLEDYFSTGRDRIAASAFLELFETKTQILPIFEKKLNLFSEQHNLTLAEETELHTILKQISKTRGKDLRRAFAENDPLNSGMVQTQSFKVGLVLAGLPVTDKQGLALAKAFSYGRKDVKYEDFCRALEYYRTKN